MLSSFTPLTGVPSPSLTQGIDIFLLPVAVALQQPSQHKSGGCPAPGWCGTNEGGAAGDATPYDGEIRLFDHLLSQVRVDTIPIGGEAFDGVVPNVAPIN